MWIRGYNNFKKHLETQSFVCIFRRS